MLSCTDFYPRVLRAQIVQFPRKAGVETQWIPSLDGRLISTAYEFYKILIRK